MKLEKFKEKDNKKKITIGICIILIILVTVIIVYRSFAVYEQKVSFDIIKVQVPDQTSQKYDAMVAFYLNEEFVTTIPEGKDYTVNVTCNNGAIGEWDYLKWGLNIQNITTSKTECKVYFKEGGRLISEAQLGDYVYYKPSKTGYTTITSYVGRDADVVTINPSELTLWRVIKKNDDGSVEVVSENVSSTLVKFYGQAGFKNIAGQLNLIAKAYEDGNYTATSRHMGYSNQEEFSTTITTSNQNQYGHEADTNLVRSILGTLVANKVGTTTATAYWLPSRRYHDSASTYKIYTVTAAGAIDASTTNMYNTYHTYVHSYAVRPILILKSDLHVKGEGTKDNPWKVN